MVLTKEEKERIKEEESYRNEVRNKINEVPWWKPKGFGAKFIIVIFVLFLIGSVVSTLTKVSKIDNTSTTPTTNSSRELQGKVNSSNNQLVITNLESADWTMCKLKLNEKYNYPNKTSDWTPSARLDKIKANDVFTINLSEFTLNDGTKFNGYTTKTQSISVDCENGFGYWTW